MSEQPLHRRDFIRHSAAAGAVLSLSADSYARVPGSNEKLRVGFLGCGARAQAHIDLIGSSPQTTAAAVCDVWDGHEGRYTVERGGRTFEKLYRQGLYPSAERAGLNPADRARVTKDYRHVLDRKDVDAVCVATPDHWHARMTIDAMLAGKHVYCETPVCRTLAESGAVLDAWRGTGRVMTVGCQSLADPVWSAAKGLIAAGRLGHVASAQAGCYRNDGRGWWRFYRLWPSMNARTIDWPMFLGRGFTVADRPIGPTGTRVPFDRARFAQWRCHSDFGGGMFTDLFLHPVTRLMWALGVGTPARVVGAGGIYSEYDGRDVPDVATLAADFPERCQLVITGTTIASYPVEEVIRGRRGALKFVRGGIEVIDYSPDGGGRVPVRLEHPVEPAERIALEAPRNETRAMWDDFVQHVRSGDQRTFGAPDLAADALRTVRMAEQSYRSGRALFWDAAADSATDTDPGWAASWESRSGSV